MTGIGAGCTILIIFITIQMCNTAKKVKRIRDYLDIKDTRGEQAEDDQKWKELIEQKEKKIIIPNPTRNNALLEITKKKLDDLDDKTDEYMKMVEHNFEEIRQWIPSIRRWIPIQTIAARDQKEDETIPLLEE